jgi:hypothetical protein
MNCNQLTDSVRVSKSNTKSYNVLTAKTFRYIKKVTVKFGVKVINIIRNGEISLKLVN